MFDKDLQRFSQSDVYSIICELIYAVKDDPKYSAICELAYLLDKDSFIKLIKYFGGSNLKVPSVDEFKSAIKIMQLYHYFNIENMPWKEALVKAGFERNETRSAQRNLMQFTKVLSDAKLGRDYD